jgi:flagellar biosynthesis/type III secretory pathway protein FliH
MSLPPPPRPPSVFPGAASPSQFPGGAPLSQHPGLADAAALDVALSHGARERRRDTLIEDLVPRAEEEAVLAIKAAIEQFAEERAQALEQSEKELVELVKVICRRVVLREVTLSSSVVEALVQEGLSALGRKDQVTVRLGPFFADALDHISENLRHRGIQCSVVIDSGVGVHGCVLETALGRVDESVETRLNVLLASLDTVP